ncbi:tetratricopeptide repeat protein [bacterium CPR1]|nr:tetratricopeptide repeat protein [bacterium CPR1]
MHQGQPCLCKAFVFRGASYFLLDQHQKAISDLDKALQLDPENPEALYYRGCAYLFKGDSKQAIKDYDRFLKLQTESGAGYFYRGLAHYRLGQLEPCVSDTSKAISFGLAKRSVVFETEGLDDSPQDAREVPGRPLFAVFPSSCSRASATVVKRLIVPTSSSSPPWRSMSRTEERGSTRRSRAPSPASSRASSARTSQAWRSTIGELDRSQMTRRGRAR